MFAATVDEDGTTVRVMHTTGRGKTKSEQYVGVLAFPGDPDSAAAFAAQINGA